MHKFQDRLDAGRQLAQQLTRYREQGDVIVLALPRGGVPVAFEVAKSLEQPLDVFIVRKLGVPGQEELAMGAIASGGVAVLNNKLVRQLKIETAVLEQVTQCEGAELARRETLYRRGRPSYALAGKTIILVDDGLATGASMLAAVLAIKKLNPARLVVAVPVAAVDTCELFAERVDIDEFICLDRPTPFYAVSAAYENFKQTSDEEVEDFLHRAAESQPSS